MIDFGKLTEKQVLNIIDKANKRLIDIKANDRTPITENEYGTLIKIEDFREDMCAGCLSDYDGVGYYATATERSRLPFKFFDLDDEKKLKKYKFTHILWYNR